MENTIENLVLEKLDRIEKNILLQKRVLTFEECAKYCGVSHSHLYHLTHEGKVPCSKPKGKMLYFDRLEIESWLLRNPIKTMDEINNQAVNHVSLRPQKVKL